MKWRLEVEKPEPHTQTACGRPGFFMTGPERLDVLPRARFRFLPFQAQCTSCRRSKQALSWRSHGPSATRDMVLAVETALHLIAKVWET